MKTGSMRGLHRAEKQQEPRPVETDPRGRLWEEPLSGQFLYSPMRTVALLAKETAINSDMPLAGGWSYITAGISKFN